MGRKIKSSRTERHGALFRPALEGWEKWEEDEAGAWQPAGRAVGLAELSPGEGGLIAVPVRRAFSLAVWVPGEDPALFTDLIFTQLELRGLAGRSREVTAFAWQEVAREGDEVLLHAVVLPSNLAPHYWHGEVTAYAISAMCLPPASDTVTLWEEEGGWVASVTRGDRLIHFQPLTEKNLSGALALETWMLLSTLEAGRMLGEQCNVRIFYQGDQAPDLEEWRASGGSAVELLPWPAPVRPPRDLECLPLAVRDLQVAKVAGVRRQKIALFAAAAYFLLVLALAVNTLWLHWRSESLRGDLAGEAPAVENIRATMQRWQALEPALNPLGYPLEVLYQTARLLPKDGVRLTLFQMNLDRVVVAGEASTLQAAQRFQEEVKKNPDLAAYDWTMENPRPLPTGSARFQIDGIRRGALTGIGEEDGDAGADS
jgi:hypothetical protein